jgi:cytochrome c2
MKITTYGLILSVILILSCKTKYPTTKDTVEPVSMNGRFDHGKMLTYSICGQCHLNHETHTFMGRQLTDIPGFVGKVYSHNLTNDPKSGIGTYTESQLFYLIKTGIARNGKVVPYMTRPNIADEDLKDIIGYLKSNDLAVRAKDTVAGKTRYTLVGKIGINASKPVAYKTGATAPSKDDKVSYGRYLVDQLDCFHCHSKSLLKLNMLDPEKTPGYMAGGMPEKTPEGKKIFAPNLTPDDETGIGKYTESEFELAIKDGQARDGRKLREPMPQFRHLTSTETSAIFAYLKNLKPVKNKVKIVRND